MNKTVKALRFGLMIATIGLMSACSTTPDNQRMTAGNIIIDDPFEEANRAVFKFNTAVDDAVIHPVVRGYKDVVPETVRTGISNFLQNLKTPLNVANNLLQGDVKGGSDSLMRGIVNTTVGIGGLVDVAATGGLEHEPEDFGQTLGVWGVGNGPYLVVPLFGPTTARDGAGFIVDSLADPVTNYLDNTDEEGLLYTRVALQYLDLRADLLPVLEDLQRSSIDYYASLRSTYYQNRAALVRDRDPDTQSAPEIGDYDEDF